MPNLTQPNLKGIKSGTPDPLDFRFHRPAGSASDTLKAGAVFTAVSTPATCIIAIAGSPSVRLRGLFTGGGVLSFRYLRPASVRATNDSTSAYPAAITPPQVDFTVVANVGFAIDIIPSGESDLLVTFDGAANGVVTYLDVMQL